jgi:hypothetical protein
MRHATVLKAMAKPPREARSQNQQYDHLIRRYEHSLGYQRWVLVRSMLRLAANLFFKQTKSTLAQSRARISRFKCKA